jgi:MFS transporter, DHA2 family, multidrug resistance protein
MDLTVLYLAVPSLSRDLEPSASQLLWITDIYGFLLAGFLIPMGPSVTGSVDAGCY